MNTLESKLRIAHQIQVAAMKKGYSSTVTAQPEAFSISMHIDGELKDYFWHWDKTEQELLDWWEEIEK